MRRRLRIRIFVACFAVGTGIALLLGGLSITLLELLEFERLDLVLDDELARLMRGGPQAVEPGGIFTPLGPHLRTWIVSDADAAVLPEPLRALQTGLTEVDWEGRELRVAVEHSQGRRYLVAADTSLIEPWEDRVVGGVVLLVVLSSVLSALVGRWLADRVVAPVIRLAGEVEAATAEGRPVSFAVTPVDEEIGALARVLSTHADELHAFAVREREFTAHASHELRTPLAVIVTSLELIEPPHLPDAARGPLARARSAARQMSATVDALMALARASRDDREAHTVDVGRTVRELALHASAAPGGREIEVDLAGPLEVRALPGAVITVARNLIDNALTHTPGGDVSVRVGDGRLCVSDAGIPAETDAALSGEGLGLGLSIVQRICERYGWTLEVEVVPGGGTTARVDFGVSGTPPTGPS